MSVKIVIDSTADLTPEIKARVSVVPLTVHFGDEEYIDGVTITHKQFYEKLIECDTLPSTSQATPAAFAEAFDKIVANGDSAVVLTVSSKLSGTYQSAMIAASDYEDIYVVDSDSVAIGTGILAELALELVDRGMNAKELASTLEYLKRGGRISKAVAFAGGLLNIKPVISVEDGEIVIRGKARGSKQGNNLLVEEIAKAGGVDFERPVLLGYTGLSDLLLQKYMEDSKALWAGSKKALRITPVGSVIGTHAGPGAIAAAFFKA